MDNFLLEFKKVLAAASEWGIKSVPLSNTNHKSPFKDQQHFKRFMSACHRGYEKAQNLIIELIKINRTSIALSDEEKIFRELCLRRIIDTMAFVILHTHSHVARRLVLHPIPPAIDIDVIEKAQEEANRLNNESRMSFALIADLSTFIHICDILRIDFRSGSPILSLIELKSGKINEMLLEKLSDYEPQPKSLELLRKDKIVDKQYLSQAKRILKQKIRLAQVKEIVETDKGIDIVTGKSLKLLEPNIVTDDYDEVLDKLCSEAVENRLSAGTVQYCLHIGVGCSDDFNEARTLSKKAAIFAYHKSHDKNNGILKDIKKRIAALIDKKEFIKAFDNFNLNLRGLSDTPFPLWKIKREHLFALVDKKMSICTIFDLHSFMFLGEKLGIKTKLSSKKHTEKTTQDIGRKSFPQWGGRALIVETAKGEFTFAGGMIHRFISDLSTPAQFFKVWGGSW